jgi:acyl-CoA synthetase (AMP-forming)/AMP-acid ligase II
VLHPYAHAALRAGRRWPDREAVVDTVDDRRYTWAEMVTRVGRLAGTLRRRGVGAGDRVLIVQANRAAYIESIVATAWLGAAFVPVLGSLNGRERDEISALVSPVSTVDVAAGVDRLVAEGDWVPPVQGSPDSAAQILFTSGSTGTPKGVVHAYAGSRAAMAAWVQVTAGGTAPRVLVTTPMSHAAGRLLEAVLPTGGSVVVQDGADPDLTLEHIERHRASHLLVVPTVLQRLTDASTMDKYDLSALRFLMYSASPAGPSLIARAQARFGEVLHTVWGSTELPAPNTHMGPAEHAYAVAEEPRLLRSCGREFASHVQLRVVDEDLVDVPDGEPGQLIASAPWLAAGYWGQPDVWAARTHGDWFLTGDIGRFEDGYLFLSDRHDDLIVTGGVNVYPTEVEAVLSAYPGVVEAAVVGLPDPVWGEAVTGVVALREAVAEADLLAHCRANLGRYKVPKRIIVMDELPRTGVGKVSRRLVQAALLDGTERIAGPS